MKQKLLLCTLLILSIALNAWQYISRSKQPQAKQEVTVQYVTDTISSPRPKDSTVVRTDTVWLTAVAKPDSSFFIHHSSLGKEDSLIPVEVPITQTHYSDTAYDAWVSGYHARLDSIQVHHKVTTITNTIYKERPAKEKRWSVSLQGGIGFTAKGAQPYVGIGIGWSLWRW